MKQINRTWQPSHGFKCIARLVGNFPVCTIATRIELNVPPSQLHHAHKTHLQFIRPVELPTHDYDYEEASHSPALCPATLVAMADYASFSICLCPSLSFSLSVSPCSPPFSFYFPLQLQLMTGRLIFNYKHIKCETDRPGNTIICSSYTQHNTHAHTQHTHTHGYGPIHTRAHLYVHLQASLHSLHVFTPFHPEILLNFLHF